MSTSITLLGLDGGVSDCAVALEYNNKHIHVSIFDGPGSTEKQMKDLVNQVMEALDINKHEAIIDKILDIILDIGKPVFEKVAPPTCSGSGHQSLHSHLFPETFYFQLKTIEGVVGIHEIDASEVNVGFDPSLHRDDIDPGFPQYSTEDITVQKVFVSGKRLVCQVLVNGKNMLCKASMKGLVDESIKHELFSLHEILDFCQSDTGDQIRVPNLTGYVKHPNGNIVEFVREWIRCRDGHGTLKNADILATPIATRQKWASQIRETITKLHAGGVIWGDGKPSNIIVDSNDDTWLIDFGGGRTKGWVDKELADTLEGDKQATERIERFLRVK